VAKSLKLMTTQDYPVCVSKGTKADVIRSQILPPWEIRKRKVNYMFSLSNMSLARLKMGWGYLLLVGILSLCARIALGHVMQESSYGLTEIIGILAVLAGQWANWAFGESRSSSKPDENGSQSKISA
jgi:hypothetical protein